MNNIQISLDQSYTDSLNAKADVSFVNTTTTNLNNAIALKAPLNNPAFTGNVTGISKSMVGLSNVDNISDINKPISTATQSALNLLAPIYNPTFTGNVSGITQSMVGLGNVNNTADIDKPISTSVSNQFALYAKKNQPTFTGTVYGIDKSMVGLGNVDNVSDINKPRSTTTQSALNLKNDSSTTVDKYNTLNTAISLKI